MNGAAFLAPVTGERWVSTVRCPNRRTTTARGFRCFLRKIRCWRSWWWPAIRLACRYMSRILWKGLVLQAAVALENATFHERDLEWARVQQDLATAAQDDSEVAVAEVDVPDVPGYSIAAKTTTCYEVGVGTISIRSSCRMGRT